MVLGSVGVCALVARAHDRPALLATVLVYGACLVLVYAASSAYHLVSGSDALERRLRKLDHCAIFLMIAGTCTPVFWRAFDGVARVGMLSAIWGLAGAGIALRMLWRKAPRTLYTLTYLGMGWLVAVRGPMALHALPAVGLALIVAGGVTYTVGAIVYAVGRPNPFPPVFGSHEVWHVLVLVGSALHYAAIAMLAAP